DNVNVAITAAELIKRNAQNAEEITTYAQKTENHRVKALLLGAALSVAENKEAFSENIKATYDSAKNPYYKAGLLEALASYLPNYQYIITQTFDAEHKAVSTAGTMALVSLRARESFPNELKEAFSDVFKQLIQTKDIAIVAIVSGVLSNPQYNFADEYEDFQFLYDAKNSLSLPKDNEALQVLNNTIALFEGKEEMPATKNDFNNPIDWELIKKIPADQLVKVSTSKGDIRLKLLVNEAPGSVANFYSLAEEGYFDNKNFHRVVPNFVIQGGCNRGDGYGGENYSIRSELANIRYETGSVGMASAGKDTEGTQWFITHSPTPHLDGRYTIFAEVEEGMDVVHSMEAGDLINKVEILK
ncbi:peptidylprolyl isomerase, partial [Fulvivirga aurantia]|uniref:peptidylprolyl isomerase n=1 Tax=Fulvivirga aurantia TaxID=2529383 RepID=UPI001CA3E1D0